MATFLTDWYRNMTLPDWGYKMEKFATPSVGLLSGLLPGKAAKVPVVFVNGVGTALADRKNNRIVLDRRVFSADRTERLNQRASKELSISFGLGAVLHEGGHFAWSPNELPDFLNPGITVNNLTCGIANIVEDLYIEHRIVKESPELAWMIFSVWEYLFSDDMRENKWDGVTVTNDTLSAILDEMAGWKDQNRIFTFRSDFEAQLYEMMYSVRGMTELQDRKDLIEDIIKFLKQSIKEQKQEEKKKDSQDGQKSKSSKSKGGESEESEEEDGDDSEGSEEESEEDSEEFEYEDDTTDLDKDDSEKMAN